jgi:hypothetical protein
MKPRTALLLVLLAIIVGVGGWYFGMAGSPPTQQAMGDGEAAFPGLATKLGDAAVVSVSQGGKTLTLNRDGDVWRIGEKSGYPALPEKLHALLAGIAELRLMEARTSNPDEYAQLGVGDPATDKDAALVRVLDAKQAVIAQVIVGHRRSLPNAGGADTGNQVYVRVPGQPQSWLAQGQIEPNTDPANWMGRDLTNIGRDRIADASVTHGDAKLEFAVKDGKLALVQPADHPPLDASKVEDVARAYEYLVFMDVAKAAGQPGTLVGDSVFHTKDGLTLTAHVTKDGDVTWARFSAQGKDKAADEAKTLGKLFDGWAYQIGNWKLAALAPGMDDLKAPAPKPTAAAAPAPAATASVPVPAPAPGTSAPRAPAKTAPGAVH